LHQVLHRRLDLRHVTLGVNAFAHDNPQFSLSIPLTLRDGCFSALNRFFDEEAV